MNSNTAISSLADRLATLQHRMRLAAPPGQSVQLVAASKTQPVVMLQAAIDLGVAHFGENKVQEAYARWPALKNAHAHVKLHLIGPLQSNKAAEAVALFDVIQTIDRPKIADAVHAAMRQQGRHPVCYVQVNTGEEPQKGGVAPAWLAALLAHCAGIGLPIGGLMCIPPAGMNPAPHFALLKRLAARHALPACSMGMSQDFEVAIRLGATAVRVGTQLFGVRP